MKPALLLFAALVTVAVFSSTAGEAQTPATVQVVGGAAQVVGADSQGTTRFSAIVFMVQDDSGAPVPNTGVTLTCTTVPVTMHCSPDPSTITTNSNGYATLHSLATTNGAGTATVTGTLANGTKSQTSAALRALAINLHLSIEAGANQTPSLRQYGGVQVPAYRPVILVLSDANGVGLAQQTIGLACAPSQTCMLNAQSSSASLTTDSFGVATQALAICPPAGNAWINGIKYQLGFSNTGSTAPTITATSGSSSLTIPESVTTQPSPGPTCGPSARRRR